MPVKNQEKNFQHRPPVVAVVGHVDHGKTTLLDYIRKTNVATKEVGGITQSTGAYEIEHSSTSSGQAHKITFIDTPGHEAFSLMRARGAAAADLAILVVAADEGIKPQTTEAIGILKSTETPFIVAITKIDKPNANIDKVKNELQSAEVLLEGYGGDVSWHGVSGVSGEGVNELLDLIVLTGEVAGLTFDPEAKARGFVIESRKENRRGIIAHLVLKDGVLKAGENIATPSASGKIKILEDFLGHRAKELWPSAPALVVGFEKLPRAGEEFTVGKTNTPQVKITPAPKTAAPKRGKPLNFRVILKADTTGSLEAMEALLKNLVEIGEASVGEISDSDVNFAKSTKSVIVGFNVLPGKSAARLADAQRVKIITSSIIYKVADAVSEMLKAEEEEKIKGSLEVMAVFSIARARKTIGGKVSEGVLRVGNNVEIERNTAAPDGGEPRPEAGREVVGKGKITNLQRDKEDAREVPQGNECGLVVETPVNIEVGDTLKVV